MKRFSAHRIDDPIIDEMSLVRFAEMKMVEKINKIFPENAIIKPRFESIFVGNIDESGNISNAKINFIFEQRQAYTSFYTSFFLHNGKIRFPIYFMAHDGRHYEFSKSGFSKFAKDYNYIYDVPDSEIEFSSISFYGEPWKEKRFRDSRVRNIYYPDSPSFSMPGGSSVLEESHVYPWQQPYTWERGTIW